MRTVAAFSHSLSPIRTDLLCRGEWREGRFPDSLQQAGTSFNHFVGGVDRRHGEAEDHGGLKG